MRRILLLLFFITLTVKSFSQWSYKTVKTDFDGTHKRAIVVGSGGEFPYENPYLVVRYGKENGLDICKRLKTEFPQIKIIIISMFDPKTLVHEIKKSGANGFIPKSTDAYEVKQVITSVLEGEDVFLEMDINSYIPQPLFKLISSREKEIIALIKQGKTAKQIADVLHISQFTVDTHRKNILKKLELNSIKDLIAFSINNTFFD